MSCNSITATDKSDVYKENKVKTAIGTTGQYKYKFGEPEKINSFISEIKEYNKEGLVVKRSTFYEDIAQIQEYFYNSENKLDSQTVVLGSTKRIFHYQYKDNKTITDEYFGTGEFKEKTVDEYDKKGRIKSTLKYSSDGSLSDKCLYEYDSKGLKTTSHYSFEESSPLYNYVRVNNDRYYNKFDLISASGKIGGGKSEKFDKNNRIIESYNEFSSMIFHRKYTYFENGLMKENISLDEKGNIDSIEVFEYEYW